MARGIGHALAHQLAHFVAERDRHRDRRPDRLRATIECGRHAPVRAQFAQQRGQLLAHVDLAVGGLAAPQLSDQMPQLRLFEPHRVLDGQDLGARIDAGGWAGGWARDWAGDWAGIGLANHAAAQRFQPEHRARKELRGAVVEVARDRLAHPAHCAVDRDHLRQPRALFAFERASDLARRLACERQPVEPRIGQVPQQQPPAASIAGDRHRDPRRDAQMCGQCGWPFEPQRDPPAAGCESQRALAGAVEQDCATAGAGGRLLCCVRHDRFRSQKLRTQEFGTKPCLAHIPGPVSAHRQHDPRFLLGAPRDRGAARGCRLARETQRGGDQQFQRMGPVLPIAAGVTRFPVEPPIRSPGSSWGQHRKRQVERDPPFQPHPHQQHRQQHHISGAPADALQIDRVTDFGHRARHCQVERDQRQRSPRGCAQVPAEPRLDEQQHREGHERAGEIGRRRLGIVHRRHEHRDVDQVRRARQAVIPPPTGPRDRHQHHRPREKSRHQHHAQHVVAHRLDRIEPQRGQEYQRDQRAAGRFDLARIA